MRTLPLSAGGQPAPGPWFVRFRSWPAHLIVLLLLGLLGLYLAGVSQSYDFTDEGYYYLSFAHPENISDNQTSYYLFGSKIFALLGSNVVAMRIAALAAMLAGTGVFLHGVDRFVRHFFPATGNTADLRPAGHGVALISSLLGFLISPPALSYNFQNAACLLAATGVLFRACAEPRTERLLDGRTAGLLAVFGALIGLDFFIKFSSSLPLAVLGSGCFLLISEKSVRQKAALAGIVFLTGGICALAYFGFWQDFSRWWAGIQGTAGAILHRGYARREVMRYGQEISATYRALWPDFGMLWLGTLGTALLALALRRHRKTQALVAGGAGLAIYGNLFALAVTRGSARPGAELVPFFIGVLILLGLALLASFRAGEPRLFARGKMLVAGGLLFLLPYIGAFGTNNPIHLNCLYQLAPWLVLAAWLLEDLGRAWQTAWPGHLVLLLLAGVAGYQFYFGYWYYPYRGGDARPAQETPTAIGAPVSHLHLTQEAHEFVETSRRVLQDHGFRAGDDLLVFFNLPGFVFAMGGQSPGHPWYIQGSAVNYELDLLRLNLIAPERRGRAFLVRNSADADWAEFQPYLRQAGLNFPDDYTLISPPMTSPLTHVSFEIWAPRLRLAPSATLPAAK